MITTLATGQLGPSLLVADVLAILFARHPDPSTAHAHLEHLIEQKHIRSSQVFDEARIFFVGAGKPA